MVPELIIKGDFPLFAAGVSESGEFFCKGKNDLFSRKLVTGKLRI